MPFDAVGSVEANGVFFAVWGANEEAVTIGPLGGDEGALSDLGERIGGLELAGEQEDEEEKVSHWW